MSELRRIPQALTLERYRELERLGGVCRPLTWGPMGLRKDRTPDPESLVSLTDIATTAVGAL